MAKTKARAAKSPKKPRTEASRAGSTGGKRTGPSRKPAPARASEGPTESSNGEAEEPNGNAAPLRTPGRVVWDKYPERTERLLNFLDVNHDVAIKLFGDSTQVAKLEGRSKMTAKSSKATAYQQLANGIFSVDENPAVRADFKANSTKYAKAVDNYITNT
jgi:hypothetical protein